MIKLNSFTLPDNVIEKMRHLSYKALITGKEHGFNLCIKEQLKLSNDNDKIIRSGKECEGEKCSMEIAKFTCSENERTIGIFHTHKTSSHPSMSDLSVGYLVGINCIGSFKGIKCFKRKKDFDALTFADIKNVKYVEEQTKHHHSRWKNKEINDREYSNIYSKYKKEVNRIITNHFKETIVI